MPEGATPMDRKNLVKSWWMYVIQCVQRRLKKPNRKLLFAWAKDIISYRLIYEKLLIKRFNQTVYPLGDSSSGVVSSPGTSVNKDTSHPEEMQEKERIEKEWSFDRLMLIRRAIFEKFVKNPIFKEYFVNLKQQNNASSNNADANNSSSGMYSYITWSMSNLKGYYYGRFCLYNFVLIV